MTTTRRARQCHPRNLRWRDPAFNLHNDNTGTSFTAVYGGSPAVGRWAHLVGVYDASTNQITLYVNGRQVDTTAFGGIPWNATGSLQIGRGGALGSYGEYANSEISDIHLYNTALPPADAAATGDNPTISQLD